MRSLEGRCVVGAVTRDSHHFPASLQRLHETLLVHRSCPGNNLQVLYPILELFIGEFREFRACNDIAVSIHGIIPKPDLTANLLGRAGRVAGNDLHLNSGVHHLLHRHRHIRTHRVGDSHYP